MYCCAKCATPIARECDIESRCFQVGQGAFTERKRGYLFWRGYGQCVRVSESAGLLVGGRVNKSSASRTVVRMKLNSAHSEVRIEVASKNAATEMRSYVSHVRGGAALVSPCHGACGGMAER